MAKLVFYLLLVSLGLNLFLFFFFHPSAEDHVQDEGETYPYLAKRLFVEDPNDVIINFVPMRQALRDYAREEGEKLGIYFQYLPTGISFGVNETQAFVSASLLKLPTVMKVYKMIEEGKLKKEQELTIKEENLDQRYGNLWEKGAGTKITVQEAIKESLVNSDNTAHSLLYELSGGTPAEVYDYIDIPKEEVSDRPAVSTRNYSSVLRSVFFSAYLNYDSSNEILDFLAQSREGDNLRADIPVDIKIAQKIGVYENGGDPENHVHSDCGIVYYPHRPYVICVMYQGREEMADEKTKHISNLVYNYIKDLKK